MGRGNGYLGAEVKAGWRGRSTTAAADLEAQTGLTASPPTAELVEEPQQGAVLEPVLSASVEIAGASHHITFSLGLLIGF